MYDAVANNLIIREWLNGSLFPLCANLAFIILVFLVVSYSTRDGRAWRDIPGVRTGCGLFWVFAMETIRASWIWWMLREQNDGRVVEEWARIASSYSFVFAAAILVVTILWCIHLWSPPKWRPWFWIYSAISTLMFLFISHNYPDLRF